eukprot:GHRR01030188.1.p1 GENE.GHRR01030188.1~~GHRR01030188.1.p1  ORF type:complete len:158 (+),score=30.07 GHRR01030188.1:288-761(+)
MVSDGFPQVVFLCLQGWVLSFAPLHSCTAIPDIGAAYSAGDPYARPHKASLPGPPDFFCGVVPGNVLSNLGKAVQLEGAAGLAVRRLSREGLAWVPTAGNIATLLAFGICVYLNMYMTGKRSTRCGIVDSNGELLSLWLVVPMAYAACVHLPWPCKA